MLSVNAMHQGKRCWGCRASHTPKTQIPRLYANNSGANTQSQLAYKA